MSETATPALRTKFALHMRMQNGSTIGHNLIDPDGNVVGAVSSYTPKNKRGGRARTIYSLQNPAFETESKSELLSEWQRRHAQKGSI